MSMEVKLKSILSLMTGVSNIGKYAVIIIDLVRI